MFPSSHCSVHSLIPLPQVCTLQSAGQEVLSSIYAGYRVVPISMVYIAKLFFNAVHSPSSFGMVIFPPHISAELVTDREQSPALFVPISLHADAQREEHISFICPPLPSSLVHVHPIVSPLRVHQAILQEVSLEKSLQLNVVPLQENLSTDLTEHQVIDAQVHVFILEQSEVLNPQYASFDAQTLSPHNHSAYVGSPPCIILVPIFLRVENTIVIAITKRNSFAPTRTFQFFL